MKHVSIQEMPQAIRDWWTWLETVPNEAHWPLPEFDMAGENLKNAIVGGEYQLVRCGNHVTLLEQADIPYHEDEAIAVIKPQCPKCIEQARGLARIRELKQVMTVEFEDNRTIMTYEKVD